MGVISGGQIIEGAVERRLVKQAVVAGGAAGDHTVTGILSTDSLISVFELTGGGTDITGVTDLTAEFSVSAADTINNDAGTDTTGDQLLVTWSTGTA